MITPAESALDVSAAIRMVSKSKSLTLIITFTSTRFAISISASIDLGARVSNPYTHTE